MTATIGTRLFTWWRGKYVGRDAFGNRYYTERRALGQAARAKRWVVYRGLPEASKVPPLWHAWLHYTTDTLPTEKQREVAPWEQPHLPNLTGTAGAYLPPGHARHGRNRAASTSDYEPWRP